MSLETKVADLERTLVERDNEIARLRNMLVNPPINGRIAMITVAAGDENFLYALTNEGQIWQGTWRLPSHKFSWERIPDLPEEAR